MKLLTYVILPDVHVPFHNKKLLNKVCKALLDLKPQGLVLSGDFLDLYTLSRHNAGSLQKLRHLTLTEEYKRGNQVLDQILLACKSQELHYLWGNHEDNYLRYLQTDDNAKVGSALLSPTEALRLRERGFRVYENWKEDSVLLGSHLEVIHGVYTCKHPSFKHLEDFEGSVVFGHTHKLSSYMTGKREAHNIGFLGDIDSLGFHYAAKAVRRKWRNGFALVNILDDGDFIVTPVSVWQNRFYLNGVLY